MGEAIRPESVHGSYDIRVKDGIFYTLDKNRRDS